MVIDGDDDSDACNNDEKNTNGINNDTFIIQICSLGYFKGCTRLLGDWSTYQLCSVYSTHLINHPDRFRRVIKKPFSRSTATVSHVLLLLDCYCHLYFAYVCLHSKLYTGYLLNKSTN